MLEIMWLIGRDFVAHCHGHFVNMAYWRRWGFCIVHTYIDKGFFNSNPKTRMFD